MKKNLIIFIAFFLTTTLWAQNKSRMIGDIAHEVASKKEINSKMGPKTNWGVYIKNTKPIKLKTVYINILDDKYSKESFELRIVSAPKMNSGRMYKKDQFPLLHSGSIICQAKSGGIMKIDIEKYNISTSNSFIIEVAPTDETKKNPYFIERKKTEINPATGTVKEIDETEQICYYGCSILNYHQKRRDVFGVIVQNDTYICMSDQRLKMTAPMIAVEVLDNIQ